MRILGISCYFHDSAAVLLEDGGLVAAAEEERLPVKNTTMSFLRMPSDSACNRGISPEKIWIMQFFSKNPS